AASLFRNGRLHAAPIVDGSALIGLVTVTDLIAVLGAALQPARPLGLEHILAAATFDALGNATVDTAASLAREHEAPLTLLHAIVPPSLSLIADVGRWTERQRHDDAVAHLGTLTPPASELNVARLVVTGEPAEVIVAAATRLHADLILVGQPPRGWLRRHV